MQTIKLNNGIECPVIGLGTFMLSPANAQNSTREALKMGYRLIDTANAYVNERAVGRGIKESGVSRNEVFLSTKLWPSEYETRTLLTKLLNALALIMLICFTFISQLETGLKATVSLKRLSTMEKPAQSAFLILKVYI